MLRNVAGSGVSSAGQPEKARSPMLRNCSPQTMVVRAGHPAKAASPMTCVPFGSFTIVSFWNPRKVCAGRVCASKRAWLPR